MVYSQKTTVITHRNEKKPQLWLNLSDHVEPHKNHLYTHMYTQGICSMIKLFQMRSSRSVLFTLCRNLIFLDGAQTNTCGSLITAFLCVRSLLGLTLASIFHRGILYTRKKSRFEKVRKKFSLYKAERRETEVMKNTWRMKQNTAAKDVALGDDYNVIGCLLAV